MKHLKSLLAGLLAALALIVAAPAVNAQTGAQKLSPSEMKMAVAAFSSQLPLEIAEGASIDKITINDDATLLTIVFKFNPAKMGISLAEAKSEMSDMSANDMRALIGDDIDDLFKVFDCDVDIVISFPDKTSQTFHMKR